jgi:elongation factor Ts
MKISKDTIQKLREKTGAPVMVSKKALEKSGGDFEKALEYLKEEADVLSSKKESRVAKTGIIECYVHAGKIGVLVEVRCETDFVARNPEFKEFARDIAMQIAASNPRDVKELLEGNFIKDLNITVSDYLKQTTSKFGEKIEISRFSRLEL